MSEALQIATNFVVVNDNFKADVVPVDEQLYAKLDATYGDFAGHSLISCHTFDADWPTWEVHPHGDEFVVLLSGSADMVLLLDGSETVSTLNEPGQFVIVPRGTWHTARVSEKTQMLFVTPGEGTENRESPRLSDA